MELLELLLELLELLDSWELELEPHLPQSSGV